MHCNSPGRGHFSMIINLPAPFPTALSSWFVGMKCGRIPESRRAARTDTAVCAETWWDPVPDLGEVSWPDGGNRHLRVLLVYVFCTILWTACVLVVYSVHSSVQNTTGPGRRADPVAWVSANRCSVSSAPWYDLDCCILYCSIAVSRKLAPVISHQSAIRQGKFAALVHCAVRISPLQPAGALKVRPEHSSYFWSTVCSGTVFPSARCRATDVENVREDPRVAGIATRNRWRSPLRPRFANTMRLPVSGARLRRAGVPIADLVAGGGRLGDDFQRGLGARLGLPSRRVSQEGDAMFVASSRILLGRMGAGMSSWWRKGASGCLPDRRCQAAEASLSLEFTLSFCPGLCLLVQGCARDGRPTPPRGRNASWNGILPNTVPRGGGSAARHASLRHATRGRRLVDARPVRQPLLLSRPRSVTDEAGSAHLPAASAWRSC